MEKITTHVVDAQKRLIYQYKNKPKMKGVINAIVKPLQEIENVCWDLIEKRTLDAATGAQLDVIGVIVKLPRPQGLEDEKYRIRLKVRIIIIVSNGEPEKLIQIFKLLTAAAQIRYIELPNAAHVIYSEVSPPAEDINYIFEALEEGSVGGVKFQEIGIFDAVNPFKFDSGKGFGTIHDPNKGGKFGTMIRYKKIFKFAGGTDKGGFGTIHDPLVGGRFVTV